MEATRNGSTAVAPMMPVLERTVVQLKTLNEQPQTPYVLLLSGAGAIPDLVIAVDSWKVNAESVIGLRADALRSPFPIVAFSRESSWAVLHRTAFVEMKREDAIRQHAQDAKDLDALHGELADPAGAAMIKKARRAEELQLERTLQELESQPAPGHYL